MKIRDIVSETLAAIGLLLVVAIPVAYVAFWGLVFYVLLRLAGCVS